MTMRPSNYSPGVTRLPDDVRAIIAELEADARPTRSDPNDPDTWTDDEREEILDHVCDDACRSNGCEIGFIQAELEIRGDSIPSF